MIVNSQEKTGWLVIKRTEYPGTKCNLEPVVTFSDHVKSSNEPDTKEGISVLGRKQLLLKIM